MVNCFGKEMLAEESVVKPGKLKGNSLQIPSQNGWGTRGGLFY